MFTLDTKVHQKSVKFAEDTKEPTTASAQLTFEVNESEEGSDNELPFDFDDVAEQLECYESYEMTTFQKIDGFLCDISNQQLTDYIKGSTAAFVSENEGWTAEHRFFCD